MHTTNMAKAKKVLAGSELLETIIQALIDDGHIELDSEEFELEGDNECRSFSLDFTVRVECESYQDEDNLHHMQEYFRVSVD